MRRMLSKTYADRAPQGCPHGCCTVRELHTHGGRNNQRVRRWARAADKREWRRDVDAY